MGQFSDASAAYQIAAATARSSGQDEIALLAETCRIVVDILAGSDTGAFPDHISEQPALGVLATMSRMWLGFEMMIYSTNGAVRLSKTPQCNTFRELLIQIFLDAVEMRDSADAAAVAARIGDKRRESAETLLNHYESNEDFYRQGAWVVGLVEDRSSRVRQTPVDHKETTE